jgi:predicted AlkP superfamily phosphohydrolase/phosphomutase
MASNFAKVLVLGLDGLEPTIAESMIAAGQLPHLAGLRQRGSYTRVRTTSPAQTPVAWSSVATGTNPGGHGIFDFLRRDPTTYLPDLSLNRYEQKNAFTAPKAVNLRRGTPVWERLTRADVPSTILRFPCTYPPDPVRGRMLAGMGVPDLRGGLGTGTFYTSAQGVQPGESEQVVTLPCNSLDGSIRTHLVGPRNPRDRADLRLDITLRIDRGAGRLVLSCPAATPRDLELRPGSWSEWLKVSFKLGLLQGVKGLVRFHLVRLEPEVELYASPINFDPESPPFPISAPTEFARELLEDLGPYYTTGMVEDHAALSNGRIDESAFLSQCAEVWDEREAMMLRELERFDSGLFYCLFDTTDRVQHLFWRFRELDHPANRGRKGNGEYAKVIEETYRRADAAVGAALEGVDDRTLVLVLSDHGFGSFRRCVDLNSWLYAQGLLGLKDGRRPGHEAGDLLQGIDWSRTQAYAVGLGGIYLNLRGREAQGIVVPEDAESLKQAIARSLSGQTDPETGEVAVRDVLPREIAYHGPYVTESPDLVVHCGRGYRVSWSTSLGGVAANVFEDNTNAWAGDHIVDPTLVPGVLFSSHPLTRPEPHLVDLAPTILEALGVPKGAAMEGSSLLS